MKKWICIGLFLIGTCSVQAQDLVSDFLAKTKENKVFTQVNISSRMFQRSRMLKRKVLSEI